MKINFAKLLRTAAQFLLPIAADAIARKLAKKPKVATTTDVENG